jgi:hypothetical protein
MNNPRPANGIVMPEPRPGEAGRIKLRAMSPTARITGFAGAAICLGLCAVLFGAAPAVSQQPQRVISDTPEYCLQLLDRVSELVHIAIAPPPQEVTFLSTEGQRMCNQGQTRGGILRLRRALMLMTHQRDEQ